MWLKRMTDWTGFDETIYIHGFLIFSKKNCCKLFYQIDACFINVLGWRER